MCWSFSTPMCNSHVRTAQQSGHAQQPRAHTCVALTAGVRAQGGGPHMRWPEKPANRLNQKSVQV
jgi:hypothetical protein